MAFAIAIITTMLTAWVNSGGSTEQKPHDICSAQAAAASATGTSAASIQRASYSANEGPTVVPRLGDNQSSVGALLEP
ncbi:hypothetical protein PLANPX_3706 [Lacipirellula parvula]|uniref:Uncharacterized protein n=1 Tax=Lacipirellula parvula TaxID=2650471 RepID=A0A5K7XBC4_9BACT|nr:hypothetical protein PLANPX_3706 [Lacipirellula parvula]